MVQPIIVWIPLAHVVKVRHLLRRVWSAFDRQIVVDCQARNASHHMYAKFESHGVDLFGKRCETVPACSAGESFRVGQLTPVFVEDQRRIGIVTVCAGGRVVPVDVDDDRIPAGVFQVFRHESCVGKHFAFSDGGAVGIPAVPAHWRSPCFWQILGNRHCLLLVQR